LPYYTCKKAKKSRKNQEKLSKFSDKVQNSLLFDGTNVEKKNRENTSVKNFPSRFNEKIMKINVTGCGFGSYAQPTQGIKYGSEVSTYRVGLLFSIYTLGGLGIQPKPASGDIYI